GGNLVAGVEHRQVVRVHPFKAADAPTHIGRGSTHEIDVEGNARGDKGRVIQSVETSAAAQVLHAGPRHAVVERGDVRGNRVGEYPAVGPVDEPVRTELIGDIGALQSAVVAVDHDGEGGPIAGDVDRAAASEIVYGQAAACLHVDG